ncbi:MAG: hypothetical protein JWN93_2486 [Hyphomicrobiales bacterium]|nr:hypothetical protein [Hyphomicrobiales bacterium]
MAMQTRTFQPETFRREPEGWRAAKRAGLPQHLDARRERLERIARLMDTAVRIPGTGISFGADAILGVVPVLGNIVTTGVSAYLIWEARQLGAPLHVLARMAGNVGLDALVSAVPVAGNVADVFFKANRRNVDLLRRHFDAQAEKARRV